MMRERPILFTAAMVRAILEGRKTQTRRVIAATGDYRFGVPGDRLWVREAFRAIARRGWLDMHRRVKLRVACVAYGATETMQLVKVPESHWHLPSAQPRDRWMSGRFMPRWACRLILEVAATRVEEVQDISDADALAEGVQLRGTTRYEGEARDAFAELWDSINKKRGYEWAANPQVAVGEFKIAEVLT